VEDDWEAAHRWASDPEVVRFMHWGPNSEEETRDHIRRRIADQQEDPRRAFHLAVALKATGHPIGSCALVVTNWESRQGGLGYCYAREFWGQGYGTEAARALLALGFEQLGLHRIRATGDRENIGSRRIMEKIGMRREGLLLEDDWLRGHWRDTYSYAILEQEWRAGQE
jgi:RimJ/RimL family protein N-acetyltransferase